MFEAPVVEKQRNKDLLWPMLLLGFLAFLSFSLVALLPFYTGDIGKDDVCAHPRLFVPVYVHFSVRRQVRNKYKFRSVKVYYLDSHLLSRKSDQTVF